MKCFIIGIFLYSFRLLIGPGLDRCLGTIVVDVTSFNFHGFPFLVATAKSVINQSSGPDIAILFSQCFAQA